LLPGNAILPYVVRRPYSPKWSRISQHQVSLEGHTQMESLAFSIVNEKSGFRDEGGPSANVKADGKSECPKT
jgi:hypothetical protein